LLAGGVQGAPILCFGPVDDAVECLEQFFSFLGLDERIACAVELVERLAELAAQLGEARSVRFVVRCSEFLEDGSPGCLVLGNGLPKSGRADVWAAIPFA
jgi:hypothetical protein